MSRILYALSCVLVLVSCAESYSIQGSSSVTTLEGNKLYLRVIKNNEVKAIDSCDVVHGQFSFAGRIDTTRMCNLCIDDQSMMPIVLEPGEITIKIDNLRQNVSGTPLNEALYKFLDHHNQLSNQKMELASKQSQMILEGIDEQTINRQLTFEAATIAKEEDSLVTNFIVTNFDNVLGPRRLHDAHQQFPISGAYAADRRHHEQGNQKVQKRPIRERLLRDGRRERATHAGLRHACRRGQRQSRTA